MKSLPKVLHKNLLPTSSTRSFVILIRLLPSIITTIIIKLTHNSIGFSHSSLTEGKLWKRFHNIYFKENFLCLQSLFLFIYVTNSYIHVHQYIFYSSVLNFHLLLLAFLHISMLFYKEIYVATTCYKQCFTIHAILLTFL